MNLVIFGIFNAVLLVLLLLAFLLIRSGSKRGLVPEQAAPQADDAGVEITAPARSTPEAEGGVIDLRDEPSAARIAPGAPTMPVYNDPVFKADGTPLPENAFEVPHRNDAQSQNHPLGPAPIPPPIGSPLSLTSLSRSAIVIDSSMNGSGPTPSELLFSVIETLGGIGFELTKDSPDYGLLKDSENNTASVDLTKRPNGTDRIAIAVDSPRAVEALAMLEIWHRSRLGATDQVRLSARIR